MEDKKLTFLTHFLLDNEYNIEKIPKKDNILKKKVMGEKKTRILVELIFLFNKSQSCKNKIYKFINKNKNEDIESSDLHNLLENKSMNQLNKLLESCRE